MDASAAKTRQDVVTMMLTALKLCKDSGATTIGVNAEDASRTDLNFLIEFATKAREAAEQTSAACARDTHDRPIRFHFFLQTSRWFHRR